MGWNIRSFYMIYSSLASWQIWMLKLVSNPSLWHMCRHQRLLFIKTPRCNRRFCLWKRNHLTCRQIFNRTPTHSAFRKGPTSFFPLFHVNPLSLRQSVTCFCYVYLSPLAIFAPMLALAWQLLTPFWNFMLKIPLEEQYNRKRPNFIL